MAGTITVKKWDTFQHYKHRSPPWIRFYRRILSPAETPWYRGVSDNGWRFLTELWLLASEGGGTVAFDTLLILRATNRPTTDKPFLDAALQELASTGAIALAGTDASADFLATLATEYRVQIQRQSTEPKGSAAGSPSEKPPTFHRIAAPALRSAGVPGPEIADTLKNWWPVAVRLVTGDAELAAFVLWAGREKVKKGIPWNPAARWNVRNAEGVEAFKYLLAQFRVNGQGGAKPRHRGEHGVPERLVVEEDFGT
jgi:hypothetical protein